MPSRRLAALLIGGPLGQVSLLGREGRPYHPPKVLASLENTLDDSIGFWAQFESFLPLRSSRPCRTPGQRSGQGQRLLHIWRRVSWAGTISPGLRGASLKPTQPAGPKPGIRNRTSL